MGIQKSSVVKNKFHMKGVFFFLFILLVLNFEPVCTTLCVKTEDNQLIPAGNSDKSLQKQRKSPEFHL